MRLQIKFFYIFQLSLLLSACVRAQKTMDSCAILNRVSPDGALFYFTRPEFIDSSSEKQLRFMILTDRLSYYLALMPRTGDLFEKTPKLKEQLRVEFDDKTIDSLEAYDLQLHHQPEEILIIFFRINNDQLRKLLSKSVQKLHFKLTSGMAYLYQFDIDSDLLREKLNCILNLK